MPENKDKTLKTLKQVKEEAAFYEKVKIVAAIALLGAGGFFVGRKLYNDSIYNEILKWICEDFLNFQTEEECKRCKEHYSEMLKDKTQKEINEIHKIIKAQATQFHNAAEKICNGDADKTSRDCRSNPDYLDNLGYHKQQLAMNLSRCGIAFDYTPHSIPEF